MSSDAHSKRGMGMREYIEKATSIDLKKRFINFILSPFTRITPRVHFWLYDTRHLRGAPSKQFYAADSPEPIRKGIPATISNDSSAFCATKAFTAAKARI